MSEQTISDIIRGMQHAVNTAEDMLTAHQLEKLTEAFNEDGTPKMRFITLPDGRKVYIPLVSLTPSSSLTISELEMEFSVHGAREIGQRGIFGRTVVREVPDS